MGVSCHDHPCGADIEGGLVIALGQERVVKVTVKETANEFGRRAPAAPMHHLHRAFERQSGFTEVEPGLGCVHAAASAGNGSFRKRP